MPYIRSLSLATALAAVMCCGETSFVVSASAEQTPTRGEVIANVRRLGITVRFGDHLYRNVSSAMEPTLHCAKPAAYCQAATADRFIVKPYSAARRPARGDIVAFETPTKNGVDLAKDACGTGGVFVKRLIGLPGDRIHEDGRGFIWVNGKKLEEPYVQAWRRQRDVENRNRSWTVPSGAYFFAGDNRWQSCDSRRWGSVPRADIVGRAVGIYWPTARVRRM